MKTASACATFFTGLLLLSSVQAQESKGRQDLDQLKQSAEQFLQQQSSQLPGQVSIEVNAADKRLNLPACTAPVAFFPNGSKAWGKTTVGLRCLNAFTVDDFLAGQRQGTGTICGHRRTGDSGQQINASQLMFLQGDLTSMPHGVITDMQQVLGKTSAISLAAGAPLRQDALRKQQVVQQGQVVKLISSGPGFQVSAEARAMNNASDGQMVQVKTASGQQISGIALTSGAVQVNY